MSVDANVIDNTPITSLPVDLKSIDLVNGGIPLTQSALCATNNTQSTMVFDGQTWNLLDNIITVQNNILNPDGVVTGWSVASTVYSTSSLSKPILPFYPSGVYLLDRARLNATELITYTIGGLNNAALYSFLFSGGTTSAGGAGTRETTITSNVSADVAIFNGDPLDPISEHITTLPLQSPSAGSIILTATNTDINQTFISTLEIKEFS
jgi:hypothetical protein